MRSIKSLALCSIAAALLVACGGGGNGNQSPRVAISALITFGDSLSDVGTYAVGGIASAGGGKWTVNSPTAKNWTELIAAQYGLPAPCAANTGMPNVGAMPLAFPSGNVAAATPAGCKNYAQGSSRVTKTSGPGAEGTWQILNAAAGAVTANASAPQRYTALPLVSQMAQVTSYTGSELVTVAAGANDVFMQANGVSSANAGGAGAVGAGLLNGWTNGADATAATLSGGTATATSAAQTLAVAGMTTAATDLANMIKAQVTKGAKRIVVVNIPNIAKTPFGLANNGAAGPLFTLLVTTFNNALSAALASTPEVKIVDAYTISSDQSVNPAQYGLTNVTDSVCSTSSTANPFNLDANTSGSRGSSIGCTAASSIAGDTSHYLFADGVHPTPFGYQLLAQGVTNTLVAAGWL